MRCRYCGQTLDWGDREERCPNNPRNHRRCPGTFRCSHRASGDDRYIWKCDVCGGCGVSDSSQYPPGTGRDASCNCRQTYSYSSGSWECANHWVEKGGVCLLSTVCVREKGLPDDCRELQILRSFRDDYLLVQPGGKDLVASYYSLAPRIVTAIEHSGLAQFIYRELFTSLVLRSVSLIDRGEYDRAVQHYRAIVEELLPLCSSDNPDL